MRRTKDQRQRKVKKPTTFRITQEADAGMESKLTWTFFLLMCRRTSEQSIISFICRRLDWLRFPLRGFSKYLNLQLQFPFPLKCQIESNWKFIKRKLCFIQKTIRGNESTDDEGRRKNISQFYLERSHELKNSWKNVFVNWPLNIYSLSFLVYINWKLYQAILWLQWKNIFFCCDNRRNESIAGQRFLLSSSEALQEKLSSTLLAVPFRIPQQSYMKALSICKIPLTKTLLRSTAELASSYWHLRTFFGVAWILSIRKIVNDIET